MGCFVLKEFDNDDSWVVDDCFAKLMVVEINNNDEVFFVENSSKKVEAAEVTDDEEDLDVVVNWSTWLENVFIVEELGVWRLVTIIREDELDELDQVVDDPKSIYGVKIPSVNVVKAVEVPVTDIALVV